MFVNNIHIRIRFFLAVIAICLIIIVVRVFYIQVFAYDKLNTLAESLWSRNLPIEASRGLIVDRNGKILATNNTTASLVVVPNQIVDKNYAAEKISEILNVPYDDILAHLNKNVSMERIHPEGRRLDHDVADEIDSLKLDGIYLLKENERYYPYEDLLSHTLGYVGIDNQGLSGIELYYDEYLTGENGSIKYFSDGKGNKLEMAEIYEAPVSGVTVELTIDLNLQLAVENELNNVMDMYDAKGAMALAMDPNTGEILAISSKPSFDSNEYQNYNEEIINRNLPIWMTFEPGSTFKILTLSAALEEEVVNLFTDTYFDSGSINVEGSTLHCWKSGGHGLQTYLEVVENSCNTGFVDLGQKLGTETLMKYVHLFGYGEKTGIDVNGESTGILFDVENMGPVETATTAFGQGISVTPIQQVAGVSAAVNGGNLYVPYLAKSFLDSETNSLIHEINPILKRNVISEDTSDLVAMALESVVANGTGRNAYIENYRIGGKTGTAQKVIDGAYSKTEYILSFIGFMPADDPEIVLYVAIDSPKGVVQYGGTVAAPVAKNIFTSAINILGIEPSEEVLPKEYTWLDEKYVQMPCTEGETLEEALKMLKGFEVEYSGTGDKVFYQTPECNSYIKEGSKVILQLN